MGKESPEKNKKRKLKTGLQVEALENCYEEDKYPSEFNKLKIAEETGLTLKQVSGWFCHRRLKDKRLLIDKLTNTRQDHSSVVIQDRGSGLGQDSCGSSKYVDNYIDPREAESRRPYGSDFSSGDIDERRNPYNDANSGTENTSSDSCSSLQDRLVSREYPRDTDTSRYLTHDGVNPSSVPWVSNSMPYKPSGYLKVKGEIENAAITAVKKQLGMQYKADGPPLVVEFQQLPPGAFQSSVNCESYYVGNPAIPSSLDMSAVKKRNNYGPRYERQKSMRSQDQFMEEAIPTDTFFGSEPWNKNPYRQKKNLSSFDNSSYPLTGQDSPTDFYKESPLAAPSYRKSNSSITSCSYIGEKTFNSVFNQLDEYGPAFAAQQRDGDMVGSKGRLRHEYSKNRQAKLMQSSREPYHSKENQMTFDREIQDSKDYSNPVNLNRRPRNDMTVAKQARGEFMRQDFSSKAPLPDHKYPVERCGRGMLSGASEEETTETSSSSG